jgi:hypothetical protein
MSNIDCCMKEVVNTKLVLISQLPMYVQFTSS